MKCILLRNGFAISLLFFFSFYTFAQNTPITGKVTDATNNPLAGVTVGIRGSKAKTTTNNDGSFRITTPSANSTLIFTYVGFGEQEVALNNRRDVSVSMIQSSNSLEDVVVIGYGTQKRKNVTGAVSSFDARKLDERPIQRIDQALVGQLAGVTVKQTTGIPGKAFSVQVRGSGSISGGNEPLYVIDGFPLAVNASNATNGNFTTGNPLDNINPNDIESIEVLKDAAAAAIYGSKGANGVVMITTKRGQTGKPRINFNIYGGYNQASRKLNMMNGDQWIALATEIINATYVATFPGASATDDQATRLARNNGAFNANYIPDPRWTMPGHPGLEYVDWQDAIERKGSTQNYEISASGGTDAVKYFLSGNYANQDGFVIGVGYKAYSLRANLEVSASNKLKFGVNIAPTFSITQDPGVDGKDAIFHQALSLAPVQEDTMGLFPNTGKNGQYAYSSTTNSPLGKLTYNKGTTKRFRTIGTIYGDYQILKGLNFRSSVNLDNTDNNATTYVNYLTTGTQASRTFTGSNNLLTATSGTYNSYRRQTFAFENTLTYNKVFHNDHNLTLLAGYSYNFDRLDRVTESSNGGFTSAIVQTLGAAAAVTGNTQSNQNVFISYFGRVLYSYKEKYLLLASFRRDASSRFGESSQFGSFPAASIGWVISQENFMKTIPVISNLKLRLSYGASGNINPPSGDYPAFATIGNYNYVFGSTPISTIGQAPNVLANPNVIFEKSNAYDVGLDFGILKNRITGAIDIYNKKTDRLFLNQAVPAVTGFPSFINNIGSVRNVGQELEVTTRNFVGKFQWTTSINVTHNTNKILALAPGQTQIIVPNGFNVTDQILRIGSPLNSVYVLKVIGFLTADDIAKKVARYNNEQEGDFKFEDINNDGIITEADKQILGHPNPDYTYGITNTFRYKGFDLNFLVQGQTGGSIYSELGRAISRPGQGRSDNHPESYVNRWKSPTDQGEGRFSRSFSTLAGYNNPITAASDWLYSSNYIRVRDITLGYDLKKVFNKNFIQNARIYFTLENFFGHDKYINGLNPEAANTTVGSSSAYPESGDYGALPLPKSLIFGLNITF